MTTTATHRKPSKRRPGETGRTAALICGVIAPLLYIGTDLLAGALTQGYSFTSQSASDLSAIGTATRPLVLTSTLLCDALLMIFGCGLLRGPQPNTALRISASLLAAYGMLSIIATAVFPSHLRETTQPATAGVVVSAGALVCMLAAIGFAAAASHGWFRWYSLGTLALFAVLTMLGITAQSKPHIGLQERTMFGLYLLWVLLLATVSLRSQGGEAAITPSAGQGDKCSDHAP